jgi:transposase
VSKPELLIKAVTLQGLSYGEAAKRYGVSKTLVHRLHHRWLLEGDAAFQPRSSRPATNPNRTPQEVVEGVLKLRRSLQSRDLDAGADTIHSHLSTAGIQVSRSSIWRILKRAGQIEPHV